MTDKDFTHFDEQGRAVMVDVSAKDATFRTALAGGDIAVSAETLAAIRGGTAGKGDVLGTARIAGIMAAKKTSDIIPLCHPLNFEACAVDFSVVEAPAGGAELPRIEALCSVKLSGKTGAEMEALMGVSAALLTIYDMCKALDRGMVMGNIRLLEKSGGKSGHFLRPADRIAAHD
ncbi:MAG: cyclic pyranopterin monophosphate synthase MoaC [Treponema sp.]|jgi:cyclic pyranopterin phosphate synthase|nr:cyclic pyranopterin monophosphate synthase MoaC [Treponema sp.]